MEKDLSMTETSQQIYLSAYRSFSTSGSQKYGGSQTEPGNSSFGYGIGSTGQVPGIQVQPSLSANGTSHSQQLHIDIDAAYQTLLQAWLPSTRRVHKVSTQLRTMKGRECDPSVYDPIMVSLGPYHHGKEEFLKAEAFKYLCLHWCTGESSDDVKRHLYDMILSRIDEIRSFYAETSIVNSYDDDALAQMMLLDACFIINFMRIRVSNDIAKNSYNCLGVAAALPFTARDIMVLENQIPFFVLKLLISQIYGEEEGNIVLEEFLNGLMSMDSERARIPREHQDPPIHLLEACRRVLVEKYSTTDADQQHGLNSNLLSGVKKPENTDPWISSAFATVVIIKRTNTHHASNENTHHASNENTRYTSNHHITCPPVTYLKAKGIRFRPSSSRSLNDIKFNSHALYGVLQLPVCHVSNLSLVFLSNMIAYELSPDNVTDSPDLAVLSYVSLMKSLIQTPADVIELQQKGIFRINRFANQEEVVHLFKSIDTYNLRNVNIYQDVMVRVGEHCNSKAKTWMADLIHGKLNSPWTIIALLSATVLLILTFLQTIYTIHSAQ